MIVRHAIEQHANLIRHRSSGKNFVPSSAIGRENGGEEKREDGEEEEASKARKYALHSRETQTPSTLDA